MPKPSLIAAVPIDADLGEPAPADAAACRRLLRAIAAAIPAAFAMLDYDAKRAEQRPVVERLARLHARAAAMVLELTAYAGPNAGAYESQRSARDRLLASARGRR